MLPVVDRELRVTARRKKTYGLRLAAALGAFLITLWICLVEARSQPLSLLGQMLFGRLAILALGYCLLIGPFVTADCVSEEKRDGTLGLLFLTELRSLDVVLGKWAANSLTSLYGLLAILPCLGVPLLLGGVTPGEFGRVALAVVNAILFSLTAGMWISTLSRDQSKAVIGTVALVLGFSGLILGLAVVISSAVFTQPVKQLPVWALGSPAYTGFLAFDPRYRANPGQFWTSFGIVHGCCWFFLLATAILMPQVWREQPDEKPTRHRWFWRFGYTAGWRRAFRRRLERNPVFAVAARLRWPHAVMWTLVLLVALNVYWLTYGARRSPTTYQFHTYFASALIFLNRVWIIVMACRFILESRRTGAMELMLTSPLPVATLLRGHWRALRRLLVGPVLVIAALHAFYVVGSWRLGGPNTAANLMALKYNIVHACGSLASFLADVVALCWLGTWLSLASRKAHLAMLTTFVWVIVVPWGLAYFMPTLRWPMTGNLLAAYLVRPIGWVLKDLMFVLWAWYKLRRHFRTAAAQAYVPAAALSRRWASITRLCHWVRPSLPAKPRPA